MSKIIAVIGAGPSGLASTKSLLEEGHRVACFEKAPGIGGLFRFDPEGKGVWESCKLTSSAAVTGFSDFPIPEEYGHHISHYDYITYLKNYADRFKLTEHIQFNTGVVKLTRMQDDRWLVRTKNGDGQETEAIYDGVAVGSGVHQHPFIPKFEGQDLFQGEVRHSSTYKNPDPFKDKKVVIIGAGESGADVISEVADVAQSCTLSLRRGVLVMPRLIKGYPNDYYTSRVAYSLPNWLQRQSNPKEYVATLRRKSLLWTLPLQPLLLIGQLILSLMSLVKGFFRPNPTPLPKDVAMVMDNLQDQSGGGLSEQFATKSERFVYALAQGKCQQKPKIKAFTKTGVMFEDGSEVEADTLLYCTGFTPSASFLDVDIADGNKLYKNVFHTELGQNIAFIGFARPGVGSLPPISEMQSRWFARLMSGAVSLPAEEEMSAIARADHQSHKDNYTLVSQRLPYLVDYTSYMDEIASYVGCRPRFRDVITRPITLFRLYCGPFVTAQFRISGPGANKKMAYEVINKLPVAHGSVPLFSSIVYLLAFKCLNKLGLSMFKPRLNLEY